jgi:fructuronate reductase
MKRLSLAALNTLSASVRRPAYDPARLRCGLVHLGVGAFHKAHQAVFTEDALTAAGGDWGIVGVSLRRPDAALALAPQDGLYTLEIRAATPVYRVVGTLRNILTAPEDPQAVLAALAAPTTHVVTITVTEPAYALGVDGELDLAAPAVAHDLAGGSPPRSLVGWLVEGLAQRRAAGAGAISILSCDNLRDNGRRLERAVATLAGRRDSDLAHWIADEVAFPNSMIDAITPASDAALLARVADATGLQDLAAVQREPFAQWVLEDRFAGPRPAWEKAGVELVTDVSRFEALKLHVLNAGHSALAYLGLPRGHTFVREAIADPALRDLLDAMMISEVSPALQQADVAGYWATVRSRFAEPSMDHRLDQIARDGAAKLRERVHPLIIANARAARPATHLGGVVRAWLELEERPLEASLDDGDLFSDPFRREPAVRASVIGDR